MVAAALVLGIAIGVALSQIHQIAKALIDGGKRHDHNTLAGILDANALSVRTAIETAEFSKLIMARMELISQILGQTSEGPYAYDKTQLSQLAEVDGQARKDLIDELEAFLEKLNGKS